MVSVDLPTFLELAAHHSVVPVSVEVLADRETPVTAYEKLVGDGPGLLLESVEGGERWARWSFLGWDPAFTLRSHDGTSTVTGRVPVDVPDGDPLEVLEQLIGRYSTPDLDGLPPLHSGAVCYLGYDVVRYVERLPNRSRDVRGLPWQGWQLVVALAAMDWFSPRMMLIRNVFVGEDPAAQYHAAVEALAADVKRLGRANPYEARPVVASVPKKPHRSNFRRE